MYYFGLFLTSRSLKYTSKIFSWQRLTANRTMQFVSQIYMIFVYGIFSNILFSGYSCARKMRHLLLAGYEDVSSFLNQQKLKSVACIYELVLVCKIQKSAQCHIDRAKCVSYNVPQKLTILEPPEDSFWMKQTAACMW